MFLTAVYKKPELRALLILVVHWILQDQIRLLSVLLKIHFSIKNGEESGDWQVGSTGLSVYSAVLGAGRCWG